MDRRHGKTPSNFDMTYCLLDTAGADVGEFLPSLSADPFNFHTIAVRFGAALRASVPRPAKRL